jgi:hypothetical protein
MNNELFFYMLKHQQEWAKAYKEQRAARSLEKNRAEKRRARDATLIRYF